MKFTKLICTIVGVVALVVSFQSHAQMQTAEAPIMELLNRMADKPEDHLAIADYYKKMAIKAREEAGLHEKMKQTYQHSHAKMKGQAMGNTMKKHCERVIELQQSAAEEYEALADLHEQAAKQ